MARRRQEEICMIERRQESTNNGDILALDWRGARGFASYKMRPSNCLRLAKAANCAPIGRANQLASGRRTEAATTSWRGGRLAVGSKQAAKANANKFKRALITSARQSRGDDSMTSDDDSSGLARRLVLISAARKLAARPRASAPLMAQLIVVCLVAALANSHSNAALANASRAVDQASFQPKAAETTTTTTMRETSTTNLLHRIVERHVGYHSVDRLAGAQSLLLEDATTTTSPTTTTTTTAQPPQEAPDFEEPIGNHTVAMGRDAQLSCKLRNLGHFRTAWLRVEDKGILTIHNNVITRNYRFGLLNNDDNERNFILTIRNVQPSDKGGYMCQINSVPMKYAVGYLDVLTPPVFDEGPAGAAQSLDGAAGGPEAALGLEGEQNDSAAAVSSQATSMMSTNSSQVTVREGASATLSCRASGHPSPSIAWRREDGKPILLNGLDSSLDASPLELRDATSLSFAAIQRVNAGAYLCIASNGVQPSASKRQLLDVQFSPIVTLPQVEVPGQLGQREARLECLVELNPAGSYHWLKLATTTTNTDRKPVVANQEDDQWLIEHDELLASDKFDIVMKRINSEKVHMQLIVRNVEKADFSWYKCVARNSLGLQSNFVRFFESSAPIQPPSSSTSSSFSFKSIFRGAGGQEDSTAAAAAKQAADEDPAAGRPANNQLNRAHTRSSWIQRSTTSATSGGARGARVEPSAAAASRATRHCQPSGAMLAMLVPYLPLLLPALLQLLLSSSARC